MVCVVGLAPPGERDQRAVVEVVVPERVESVAAAGGRAGEARLLRLVLGDDDRLAPARRLAHPAGDRCEDVFVGVVEDALRRVEAQAVHVELLDPVARVGDEELADVLGVRPVEVDRLAPLGLAAVREVVFGELAEVVAVRAEVVIDHVEDDGEADTVGLVDEAAQIIRLAVETRRREHADAVVAPTEASGEVGDRHHLDARDAEFA